MAAQSTEGIILRKYLLRETSFILVVYTKNFGKIKGVIKGVRKPYPQFAGDFEIFTRCALLFYRKKKRFLDLITQCEGLESFFLARNDILRLTYANYIIELIDTVTNDNDANENLYTLLVKALRMLAGPSSPKRTGRIFELKLLEELGLSPQMGKCVECGASLSEKCSFSAKCGGVLCPSCKERDVSSMSISLGAVNFMRKVQESDMEKILHVKVARSVGEETEEALKRFLLYYINRPIKSLRFLERLGKMGIGRTG